MSTTPAATTAYEQDYLAWLTESAALLRAGRLSELDLEHLAEGLEDMGRSERRAVESDVKVLIVHLLKWQWQPERRGVRWRLSLANARDAVERRLREGPSLRGQLPAMIAARYANARQHAALEMGLAPEALPDACPYTLGQMQDPDFWP